MQRKMMKKSIINKNEELLIKFIDDFELNIFTFSELLSHESLNIEFLQMTLDSLVKREYLLRIEKGKYCRHNFKDEYVIGYYLASKEGAIAYWSALNIHGLTEQISNTVFVQMTKVKLDKAVFNVPYKFVKIREKKYAGIEEMGYGNHTFKITNKDKTIVDCFDLPQYSGEFPGVIKAFINNNWDEEKLIRYAKLVDNKAAIKRMGFIAQSFKLPLGKFIKFAQSKVTRTVSLLDNTLPDKGRVITRWGLRLNLSFEDLMEIKHY